MKGKATNNSIVYCFAVQAATGVQYMCVSEEAFAYDAKKGRRVLSWSPFASGLVRQQGTQKYDEI